MEENQRPADQAIRVPKMAELIADSLRRRIIRGELKEGDTLPPESALMEHFGTSRPTLREAFRILESESLISIRRGARGGARVHVPSSDVAARYVRLVLEYRGTTLGDVHDALLVLEPACVAVLAQKRTKAQLAELREVLRAAEAMSDDLDLLIRAQTEFHSRIIQMVGNNTLALMSSILRDIIDRANWATFGRHTETLTNIKATQLGLKAHSRLLDHLEAKDAIAAEAIWRKHLEAAGEYYVGPKAARSLLDAVE